ncbi:hypothetical protein DPMN_141328 [Dreissena polymorpha]|uniref:C1q domain-containing protein n=1 Tax=Dreissena polymorpha TaxID=45954 RepID=A0A9D4JI68_DREPO|nr:hypothetical protein DPMN_141328 [Dreissena polymorpha]
MKKEMKIILFVLSLAVISLAAEPACPSCSKYHYEEMLLERVLRNELALEHTLTKIKETNTNVVDALKKLQDENNKVNTAIELMERKEILMEATLDDSVKTALKNVSESLTHILTESGRAIKEMESKVERFKGDLKTPTIQFRAQLAWEHVNNVNTGHNVVFTRVEVNEGQGYDKETGKFTASVAGLYNFAVHYCTQGSHYVYLEIVHNGKSLQISSNYGADGAIQCSSLQAYVEMVMADVVWVRKRDGYEYNIAALNVHETTDEQESEKDGESSADQLSTPRRTLSKKVSDLKAAFRVQRYCVLTLCEHDEGWHVAADPLPLPSDFGENLLDKFCPCFTLHKLTDMRRTGVGKPRPLLDQEKLICLEMPHGQWKEKVGNDDMTMINGLHAGFSNTNLPGTTGFASDMAKRDSEKLLDKKYQSNITRIQPNDIKPETSSKDEAFGKEKVMKSKGKMIRSAKKETEKESGLQLILPSEMAIESNQRKKESKDAHAEDVQNALETKMEIAQDVGKVGNTGLSQAPVPAKVNDPSQGQSELGTRSNSQGQFELGTRSKTFFGKESKKEVEQSKASSTQIRPRLERSLTQGPKEKLKSKACIVM